MLTFIVRRLLALVPLLLIISFGVFSLVALVRGDQARAIAGIDAEQRTVDIIHKELNLDDPFLVQYKKWVGGVVRGDLGNSIFDESSVTSEIKRRLPATMSIVLGSFVLTILIGVPLGVVSGTRPGTLTDRFLTLGSSIGIAMPEFWTATLLLLWLAVGFDIPFTHVRMPLSASLDSGGYTSLTDSPSDWARHLVMPWIASGIGGIASIGRQIRGAMIDALDQDYIRTARAKGLRQRRIVYKHALKNAALPAVTVLGIGLAYSIGGSFIIEYIFSIPGMGRYVLQAVGRKDLPEIQGVVLLTAASFVLVNLVVDVIYAYLNPKVRLS